jgi:hypothetical protein
MKPTSLFSTGSNSGYLGGFWCHHQFEEVVAAEDAVKSI